MAEWKISSQWLQSAMIRMQKKISPARKEKKEKRHERENLDSLHSFALAQQNLSDKYKQKKEKKTTLTCMCHIYVYSYRQGEERKTPKSLDDNDADINTSVECIDVCMPVCLSIWGGFVVIVDESNVNYFSTGFGGKTI